MSTIADSLAPEVLEQLSSAWLLDLDLIEVDAFTVPFITDEWLESNLGMVTSDHLWHTAWLFGIVVDDDLNWYVPDDYDTSVPLVSIDSPPQQPLAA